MSQASTLTDSPCPKVANNIPAKVLSSDELIAPPRKRTDTGYASVEQCMT